MKSLVVLSAIILLSGVVSAKTVTLNPGEYVTSIEKTEKLIDVDTDYVFSNDEYYFFRTNITINVPNTYTDLRGKQVGGATYSLIVKEGTNRACLWQSIEKATVAYTPVCQKFYETITERLSDGTIITKRVEKKAKCSTERIAVGESQESGVRVKKSDIIITKNELISDKCFELPTAE